MLNLSLTLWYVDFVIILLGHSNFLNLKTKLQKIHYFSLNTFLNPLRQQSHRSRKSLYHTKASPPSLILPNKPWKSLGRQRVSFKLLPFHLNNKNYRRGTIKKIRFKTRCNYTRSKISAQIGRLFAFFFLSLSHPLHNPSSFPTKEAHQKYNESCYPVED